MTKLHQYEFDVLPQAWSLLNDAYRGSLVLTSGLREYPDLDNMAEAQFFEFVEACRLPSWQKKELKDAGRKNDYYVKNIFWLELNDAKQLSDKFHDYMMKNSIFMSEEISERFHAMDDLIRRTIIEHDIYRRTQQPVSVKEAERLGSQGPQMLNELKSIVSPLTAAKSGRHHRWRPIFLIAAHQNIDSPSLDASHPSPCPPDRVVPPLCGAASPSAANAAIRSSPAAASLRADEGVTPCRQSRCDAPDGAIVDGFASRNRRGSTALRPPFPSGVSVAAEAARSPRDGWSVPVVGAAR
jgi:hypothetical protein